MTISANFPNLRPSLLLDFSNGKALDPRITFSRPTTARYYDANTSAIAEQNLLLQSQALATSPWFPQLSPVVVNNASTAPDETNTATSITFTTQFSNQKQQVSTVAGLSYTFSFYAKWVSGNTALRFFHENSATGNSTAFTATGTWTRFSVTVLGNASSGLVNFGVQDTNASGFGEVLIWGAQVEQRSSATAYTLTTTATVTNYIPVLLSAASNVPRFDHNPTTRESLGLLIEEQRTNLATYSEQFDTVYTTGRTTVTANTIVAPDGTLTGDKIVEDNTAGEHFLNRTTNITVTNGVAYTFSWYAKKAERTKMRLYVAAMNNLVVFYDLETGTATYSAGGTSYSFGMQNVGNGWWRCFATSTIGGTGFGDTLSLVSTGTTVSYTGDGFSGIYVWGAQLEAGGFSTSYIPTVASQVIRSADSASMTGTNLSSWYRISGGTTYAEMARVNSSSANASSINWSTNPNAKSELLLNSNGNVIASVSASGIDTRALLFTSIPGTSNIKVAMAYANDDYAASFNGSAVSTDTSGLVPDFYNQLTFSGSGYFKKYAFYPTRVTNAQLQALTGS
jgi:hypothetical protein